jgi:hypothetical protein
MIYMRLATLFSVPEQESFFIFINIGHSYAWLLMLIIGQGQRYRGGGEKAKEIERGGSESD